MVGFSCLLFFTATTVNAIKLCGVTTSICVRGNGVGGCAIGRRRCGRGWSENDFGESCGF